MTLKERLTQPGFVVSALVHAGALAATLLAFSSNERFQDQQETVPIEVITDNQFNQIMKGDKSAKEVRPDATAETEHVAALEASQPPPPPPPQAAPPPPPPPPDPTPPTPPTPPERPVEAVPLPPPPPVRDAEAVAPKPPPKPVPKPPVAPPKPVAQKPPPRPKPPEKPVEKPRPDVLAKLLQEQPTEQPAPTPAPKPVQARKPQPVSTPVVQESHFDITDITKLFTRDAPPQKGAMAHDTSRVASLGSPTANAPKMSPSFWAGLDGLMEEQYRKCWSYLGLNAGQKYIPQVRVVYGADGTLQGQPVLINPPSNPALQSLADSALRAVRHCNPLKIPEQYAPYYEEWKGRVLRFDPEEMAG